VGNRRGRDVWVILRRNILLFHQGALGDFVVTWPLALGLARAFAQSRVFYVTASQKGALAEKALRVESVDAEGGWHQLFSQEPQLPERAAKLLAGAQQIISFTSGPDDLWARNIRKLAPEALLITLSTIPPDEFTGHITQYLLGQLKSTPVVEAAMSQMLQSIAVRGLGNTRPTGGPVLLHPGAGSQKKCWPADQFLELANRIKSSGRAVQVLLGEVELERWPREQIEVFGAAAQLLTPPTLADLMNAISGASAFIGNDSGPGHLAGILGVPTVCIFGPRDPTRWRPLGPRVTAMTGEWDQMTVESVFSAAE
jgi:ADP-heptose:LPS heptosyltransferase